MRKTITALILASIVLPAGAYAQSRGEIRRDREQVREEQRELRDARRYGSARDVREERRDVREARREYREDVRDRDRNWGDNDWRDYRNHNRGYFSRGNWRAPFRYNAFRPGARINVSYYGPRYVVVDPWRYRLPRAMPGTVWVRHYNDMLLVDTRRGVVIRIHRGFFW